jgi:hypothetical protein
MWISKDSFDVMGIDLAGFGREINNLEGLEKSLFFQVFCFVLLYM